MKVSMHDHLHHRVNLFQDYHFQDHLAVLLHHHQLHYHLRQMGIHHHHLRSDYLLVNMVLMVLRDQMEELTDIQIQEQVDQHHHILLDFQQHRHHHHHYQVLNYHSLLYVQH